MNEILIRQVKKEDFAAVKAVIKAAFETPESDPNFNEWELVDLVRGGEGYLPALDLAAVTGGGIAGHILFTKAFISDSPGAALAPLCVAPQLQKSGIGKQLVREGLRRARRAAALDISWVSVLGGDYYKQFGFLPAAELGVTLGPNHPANAHLQLLPLTASIPPGVHRYCRAFYDQEENLL